MSSFEIFLIVGFALSPFVALIFVLPKKLKKEKTPPPTTEYKPEPKVEVKDEPKETKPNVNLKPAVSTDEFKDYLANRKKTITLPRHLNNPNMPTEDYIPSRFRRRKPQKQENKSISEQINDLSPELKVMMFSGVFNKKDFDN